MITCLAVSIQYLRVTDRRTDRHLVRQHSPRHTDAALSKNLNEKATLDIRIGQEKTYTSEKGGGGGATGTQGSPWIRHCL